MSPLLRRYRAERLLRDEFEALRGRVLSGVRRRLRGSGVRLDPADLEACYSLAWHGLYAAVLEGQEISNPAGWLSLVTFRRALEEHRHHDHSRRAGRPPGTGTEGLGETGQGAGDGDLAVELEHRIRLRELFEALRGRLTDRELQAATLCYLQGLTRAEAAGVMGVSESRMRKLMEGDGARRPGVAAKMSTLVQTIGEGGWCAEQGSLMRGLAYDILDREGERYRLAQLHSRECPSCRSYVLSLRGLAATLPPLPSFLHLLLPGVGAGAGAGGALATGGAIGTGAKAAAGAQPGPALGGALSATGAGGAAGGGWALAGGSIGAKLAVGCLLAVSVGAGCVAALSGRLSPQPPPAHARAHAAGRRAVRAVPVPTAPLKATAASSQESSTARGSRAALTPSARASREFGPEQGGSPLETTLAGHAGARTVDAAAASAGFEQGSAGGSPRNSSAAGGGSKEPAGSEGEPSSASPAAAEREFGIG